MFKAIMLTTIIVIAPVVVSAAIIQVPADQPTIQAGIDAAVDGDTVLVADGTYTGDGNRDIDFKGKAITVTSENGAETCIIDCQGSEEERHGGFDFHSGETLGSFLQGLTIINGFKAAGSGIDFNQSSPFLLNCTISGNQSDGSGGSGIYFSYNSSPQLKNCRIINNNSLEIDAHGGGLYIGANASPSLINCTISENTAYYGGGIYCEQNSVASFTDCIITENSAYQSGGGIGCGENSVLSLTHCILSRNTSLGYRGGGGVDCYHSSLEIIDCTISDNVTDGSGGGILCNAWSSALLINCIISGNQAQWYGGGIQIQVCSSPFLKNCSIVDNTVKYSGGGIHCDSIGCSPTIINSLIWNNNLDQLNDVKISAFFSNIQGGYPGIGNIDVDPLFIGGDPFDYHLSPNSPCIDAGTDNGAPTSDFDDNPRPQGGAVDMGAYEYQGWPSMSRTYVKMPAHAYVADDPASCSVSVWNAGTSTLNGYSLFTILDVFGSYYFAPSFSDFDCFKWSFPPGLTELTVLPEFTWPLNVGSATGIVWYAFLMNPDMTELVGGAGVFDFGWSE